MIALLSGEFVNLSPICRIAEHSQDASSPPTRGASASQCWCFLLLCGMIYWLLRVIIFLYLSPFYPQLDRPPPFPLYDPACSSLIVAVRVVYTLGPSLWASCWSVSSSLRAPRCQCSDSVSADSIFQEYCHLLTVLLNSIQDMSLLTPSLFLKQGYTNCIMCNILKRGK